MKKIVKWIPFLFLGIIFLNNENLIAQNPNEQKFFEQEGLTGWSGQYGYYWEKSKIPSASLDLMYQDRYSAFYFPSLPISNLDVTSAANLCNNSSPTPANPFDKRFTLLDTSAENFVLMDPNTGGKLPKIPQDYKNSIRIGNTCNGSEAERLIYNYDPNSPYDILIIKYALVFPAPHMADNSKENSQMNPPFEIRIETRNPVSGEWVITDNTKFAYSIFNASKDLLNNDTAYKKIEGTDMYYHNWTTIGVDLEKVKASGLQTRILITTGDCSAGAHWGYAYFTGSLTSSQLYTTSYEAKNSDTDIIASVAAPEGFAYKWYVEEKQDTLSRERILNVSEKWMNPQGKGTFSCAIQSLQTDYPSGLAPKVLTVDVENYRPSVDIIDSFMCDQTVFFTSASKVFNGAELVNDKYIWDFGDGTSPITGKDTISHKYSKSGIYTVSLTATSTKDELEYSSKKSFTSIIPGINLGTDTVLNSRDSITLNAGEDFQSYLWSTGETKSSIAVDSTGVENGKKLIWVEATTQSGCVLRDSINIEFRKTSSIASVGKEKENFVIYPNPAKDEIVVTFADDAVREIFLYNAVGQVVLQKRISSKEVKLDVTHLSSGVYTIKVNNYESKKFVISK